MPARARVIWFWLDQYGNAIPGATVEVRNAANTAAVTDTIYVNDDPDTSVYPNPFTSDANGKAEAYLSAAKRAILRFSKTGYTTQDVPVDFTFPANRFTFRGAYAAATTYAQDDVVTSGGETWVALRTSTGVTPVEGADWSKMAAKGAGGSAATTTFTPAGNIAATDVQAALTEVDAEKQALSDQATKIKAATESLASSTTLQDDDHLSFAIRANETWVVEYRLRCFSTSNTPDIKFAISAPAGAAGTLGGHGPVGADTGGSSDLASIHSSDLTTARTFGLNSSFRVAIHLWATIRNGATAGNVVLQWAQNVSDAAAVEVNADSFLNARKVP